MLVRVGLLSMLAAATLALAGCQPAKPAAAPAATEAAVAAAPAAAVTPVAAAEPAGTVATGGKCGTIAGLKCASAGDFCKTAKCGPDVEGVCTKIDHAKICTEQFKPVCACDGKTQYGNACEADRAGVSATAGACPKPKG